MNEDPKGLITVEQAKELFSLPLTEGQTVAGRLALIMGLLEVQQEDSENEV